MTAKETHKPGKDVIYVDVDDEITSIIDKVENSEQKVVALVLPKRAASLQSIVNMKLLARSAKSAGKNPVLITSEAALMPLAGAAGGRIGYPTPNRVAQGFSLAEHFVRHNQFDYITPTLLNRL